MSEGRVAKEIIGVVVSNSGIAARCGDRRVGKICRYQPLATIQLRDSSPKAASKWRCRKTLHELL